MSFSKWQNVQAVMLRDPRSLGEHEFTMSLGQPLIGTELLVQQAHVTLLDNGSHCIVGSFGL